MLQVLAYKKGFDNVLEDTCRLVKEETEKQRKLEREIARLEDELSRKDMQFQQAQKLLLHVTQPTQVAKSQDQDQAKITEKKRGRMKVKAGAAKSILISEPLRMEGSQRPMLRRLGSSPLPSQVPDKHHGMSSSLEDLTKQSYTLVYRLCYIYSTY